MLLLKLFFSCLRSNVHGIRPIAKTLGVALGAISAYLPSWAASFRGRATAKRGDAANNRRREVERCMPSAEEKEIGWGGGKT